MMRGELTGVIVWTVFKRAWSAAVTGATLFVVVSIGLAMTDNSAPIKMDGVEHPQAEVKRAGVLPLIYRMKRKRFCPGVVTRVVIDGLGVPHVAESYSFRVPSAVEQDRRLDLAAAGEVERIPVSAPVPLGAAPGPAQFLGGALWYCNWLQRVLDMPIVLEQEPVRFTILPEVEGATVAPQRLPDAGDYVPSKTPLPIRPFEQRDMTMPLPGAGERR